MIRIWLMVALADAAPEHDWTVLQTEQVQVRCTQVAEGALCEAVALLDAPIDEVCAVLEDLASYPEVFASVTAVRPQGAPDTWNVEVDLPWPLSRWDLEVLVSSADSEVDGGRSYGLTNIGRVAGLWREASWAVEPLPSGTRVRYAWTAPRWPLPAGARNDVLRRQGHNTVWAVALASGTEPRSE